MTTLVATVAQSAGSFLARTGLRETLIRTGANFAAGAVRRALLPGRRIEGRRLDSLRLTGVEEGTPVPEIFGRVRAAGQLIWAARLREQADSSRPAGKGGPRVTNYRYSLSFAIGLCEGEIARIGRVFANGEPLRLGDYAHRTHPGTLDQDPDPLIEAIEGVDMTPAYRGLAYIVFEDFPLDDFGDRLPNLEFEILRPVPEPDGRPRLEERIRAVNLIPGAGEFTLATSLVTEELGPGRVRGLNLAASPMGGDFESSIDQLVADLPNCRHVNLVVGWFGNDLRAGLCRIRPGVETRNRRTTPYEWRVAGMDRNAAMLISATGGRANYGGTPADASVVEAIRSLRARGLSVGLYPFLFMDIPPGGGLPDPYGGAAQAPFPWRGRITGAIAPGRPGTTDLTPVAATEIASFFGNARAAHFSRAGEEIRYSGPSEASWSRMILHYAALAALAGGVDFFLIGSEFRGLTTLRSARENFPAVSALRRIAGEARLLLGPDPQLTYAADWSEYFGYQPADGSRDVWFHLDPFWADPSVSCVGIDYYPPLADWRDGPGHADAVFAGPYDPAYLAANIEGGEGYDWFYASEADRRAQIRTPIRDGAFNKPHVFRPKDLRNFWGQLHYDRPGGVENPVSTSWRPGLKPIVLTEFGVPAIDKGLNSPNLFFDPRSSESALAPFSTGARDDLIQRRGLEGILAFWADPHHSPPSVIDGRAMIDLAHSAVWAWDARPFPEFPARSDLWGDAENWQYGHWLNGRTGLAPLSGVIARLSALAGVSVRLERVEGVVAGYAIAGGTSLGDALGPLLIGWQLQLSEKAGLLSIGPPPTGPAFALDPGGFPLAAEGASGGGVDGADGLIFSRSDPSDLPEMAEIRYLSPALEGRPALATVLPESGIGRRVLRFDLPLSLDTGQAQNLANALLQEARIAGESVAGTLGPADLALEPGDRVKIPGLAGEYAIESLEGGLARRFRARRTRDGANSPEAVPLFAAAPQTGAPPAAGPSRPIFDLIDLAWTGGAEDDARPFAAVYGDPWPGAATLVDMQDAIRLSVARPARVGETTTILKAGPIGRLDRANAVEVTLFGGTLRAVPEFDLLAGANLCAIATARGWEILQFSEAKLVSAGRYCLSGLLRGRFGSEADMVAEIPVGARFVLLDAAVGRPDLSPAERFTPIDLRAMAPGGTMGRAFSASVMFEGRAARPLAPVRLSARRLGNGDVRISWIRQGRIAAENLDAPEIPLGESFENYSIEILDSRTVRRTAIASAPEYVYAASHEQADFGGRRSVLALRVRQISASGIAGVPAEVMLPIYNPGG